MTYDEFLSNTPTNPVMAANYPELLQLWKRQQTDSALDISETEFDAWDKSVRKLLNGPELAFYVSPYGELDMGIYDFRKVSRLNHLAKILVHRQGLKTTNGFNG